MSVAGSHRELAPLVSIAGSRCPACTTGSHRRLAPPVRITGSQHRLAPLARITSSTPARITGSHHRLNTGSPPIHITGSLPIHITGSHHRPLAARTQARTPGSPQARAAHAHHWAPAPWCSACCGSVFTPTMYWNAVYGVSPSRRRQLYSRLTCSPATPPRNAFTDASR